MADLDRGSDDPQLAAIARHALHDEELVAAFAAGDVDEPVDVDRARSMVERCPTCRDLHRDLGAIRAATRASGTAAQRAMTRPAPRDFRLTAEDATRLRPGSPVARLAVRLGWRARIGHGIAAFGRPVGAALATFGVVGLLVGSLSLGGVQLGAMPGAAGVSAAPAIDETGAAPAASAARTSYGPLATLKDGSGGGTAGEGATGSGAAGGVVLLGGSLALVIAGLGLILAARRGLGTISAQRGN